jgi:hypothetical protein
MKKREFYCSRYLFLTINIPPPPPHEWTGLWSAFLVNGLFGFYTSASCSCLQIARTLYTERGGAGGPGGGGGVQRHDKKPQYLMKSLRCIYSLTVFYILTKFGTIYTEVINNLIFYSNFCIYGNTRCREILLLFQVVFASLYTTICLCYIYVE